VGSIIPALTSKRHSITAFWPSLTPRPADDRRQSYYIPAVTHLCTKRVRRYCYVKPLPGLKPATRNMFQANQM